MIRRPGLAVLALAAIACGKQTFLAAAFVQTPALPNPVDASRPFPQFQVLTAYFGTIDTSNPTKFAASQEAPITDATANVSFHHTGAGGSDLSEDRVLPVPMSATAPGTYELSSKDDPRLTFETGVPYTLILQSGLQADGGVTSDSGDAYGARFTPPLPIDIVEFQNSSCTLALPFGGTTSTPRCMDGKVSTALTITRSDTAPAGGSLSPAFVLVGQIDPNNPTATPSLTYKTVPDTADALLKYVLSDQPYRISKFLIPATAFPSAGYYLVSLMVVKQGKVSGNAFLGSTALAATGSAGILHAQ